MPEITSFGPVSRHITEYLTTTPGVKRYRCNTLQNPLYYYDGARFQPVSITDVADTFNGKSEGIYLRDKSIVSVGIKKADDAYKFLGLRPDEKQDGSEQIEFSIEDIQVNGKAKVIDLSTKTVLSPYALDLGPLSVRFRRQGTRICLPLTKANEGFKFALRLHLTGLNVQYRADLDEYWIYNERGQFRFRIRRPLLIDPVNGEPLLYEGEPGQYDNLVQHSLKDLGGGEYLYVKEPTEAYGKAKLPTSLLVDADTCYSGIADGYVRFANANWDTTHNATDGDTASSSLTNSQYAMASQYLTGTSLFYIFRSFFYFDTSAITGTVTSCSEFLYGVTANNSDVMAMKGTQAATLVTGDFDAFTGNSYGSKTPWSKTGYNEIAYNATGIADVVVGGTTKVCNREDSHDFDNSNPGTSIYLNGCYYADNTSTDKDPYLSIAMQTFTTHTKTVSLDALIQRTGIAKTLSLDALIQTLRTCTISVDALIQAAKTGAISIDALISIIGTKTVSLDALIQAVKTGNVSLDALISKAQDRTVSLDALLMAVKAKTISLDAVLILATGKTVSLDAVLMAVKSGAVSIDALIQIQNKTKSLQLDGMIAERKSGTISLDSILLALKTGMLSLDALIQVSRLASLSLDAILSDFMLSSQYVKLSAVLKLPGWSITPISIVSAMKRERIISAPAGIKIISAPKRTRVIEAH
jgi:hypothetical protein